MDNPWIIHRLSIDYLDHQVGYTEIRFQMLVLSMLTARGWTQTQRKRNRMSHNPSYEYQRSENPFVVQTFSN